jgi:hypothetical protein
VRMAVEHGDDAEVSMLAVRASRAAPLRKLRMSQRARQLEQEREVIDQDRRDRGDADHPGLIRRLERLLPRPVASVLPNE